jgi:hypothetical protein
MKSLLKGHHFQDIREIQEQSLTILQGIPIILSQRFFQQWQKCCKRYVYSADENNDHRPNKGKLTFHYRLRPGTFGCVLVCGICGG